MFLSSTPSNSRLTVFEYVSLDSGLYFPPKPYPYFPPLYARPEFLPSIVGRCLIIPPIVGKYEVLGRTKQRSTVFFPPSDGARDGLTMASIQWSCNQKSKGRRRYRRTQNTDTDPPGKKPATNERALRSWSNPTELAKQI